MTIELKSEAAGRTAGRTRGDNSSQAGASIVLCRHIPLSRDSPSAQKVKDTAWDAWDCSPRSVL